MNFVPCLTWVAKGIAKSIPDKLQLSTEELKSLIEHTKGSSSTPADDDLFDEEIEESNEENNAESEEEISLKEDSKGSDSEILKSENEDDGFESRYNLQSYDEDGEDQPFMNIGDVTTFVDNKEDNYITDLEAVEEDDKDEEDNFVIKETDNLLLVGHVEEESSVLEVHVYNKEEDAFYVHHDIVLPAYPLALEWLDFHPSDDTTGNYVAVGDMTSIIKIWDLDVVDILEPDYCLGKELEKKKIEKIKKKYHTDAVLSLSWNKHVRNILASGSADSSVILWDLQTTKPLNKLGYHTNKVQSLQWHPFESSFLLSGCTDGLIKLYDCRIPDAECKSWQIEGEIEKIVWNLWDPIKFLCSTDQGMVHSIDMKSNEIEHSVKAHSDAVTGLDICPSQPNILVTASMDKTIKVWDLEKLRHLQTKKLKVGGIYTAKFCPDSESILAVGGNYKSNSLKIIDLAEKLDTNKESVSKPCDNAGSLEENSIQQNNMPVKLLKHKSKFSNPKTLNTNKKCNKKNYNSNIPKNTSNLRQEIYSPPTKKQKKKTNPCK